MINRFYRRVRKVQIKIHHIRSKFDIVIQNKIPHIKIGEKHEKSVRWTIRVLTLIGVVSSCITFSVWYYSLLFSLLLFVINYIFEQIIFTRSIMLVQPLPQNWNGSKWTAMVTSTYKENLILGFAFSDKTVGIDFFNTLLAWNDGGFVNNGNIQLSLIQEAKNNYAVYLYPTFQREFIKQKFKENESKFDKRENAGKELNILVAQFCFCKVFPNSLNSAYTYLSENNQNIYIQLFDYAQVIENDPASYRSIQPIDDGMILFKQVTVCKRRDLNKNKNATEYYNVPLI